MAEIRILQKDNNRRGDLFGRLMADLFVALGYKQPRLNVHKSGREVDLQAVHRLEKRRAIGECKAVEKPIGGDDLNKFAGVLDVEHDPETATTGYFISLSGFTESARDQERERAARGRQSIVLVDQTRVVQELIDGRLLIPPARATEVAGRIVGNRFGKEVDSHLELLAHERGWVWAVYYTGGKVRTDFVLVHSDGTPLGRALCNELVESDRACGGSLHSITCLNREAPPTPSHLDVQAALQAYGEYLSTECGSIQLDGLPADSDVGSRRLRLENLFVPLHLDIPRLERKRQAVGVTLLDHQRLAILAPPGGGKSTLVKRLAVAYSDVSRRMALQDDLPRTNWLPLFFRCRELREHARSSFHDLIGVLSEREPLRAHQDAFRAEVDRALAVGRVILLVDGLDEISDPGDRAAFVCTMRSTLQAYPDTAIVITSREAGFRHVAAHLASVCTLANLSPFDEEDIRRLTIAWHREVVGDTEKVREDAEQLARSIITNDRIRQLAINPLLLTTLLLVKRWLGSLPTKRAVLYGKAVEVLLMTWNTEGYDPIPEDEALPQLCYVAASMMLNKVERISRPDLARLLQEARQAFPSELAYVKGTVDEFIKRVEERSSLMMMTGHDVENGQLVEFFEFRHLTFQEYLTAKAFVQGWVSAEENRSLVEALRPHFEDDKWKEVIPLAAVLAGNRADTLIRQLSELCATQDKKDVNFLPGAVLGACLADEAPARPETIQAAVRALTMARKFGEGQYFERSLCLGKYGPIVRSEVRSLLRESEGCEHRVLWALKSVAWRQSGYSRESDFEPLLKHSISSLQSNDPVARCESAACCASLAEKLEPEQPEASRLGEEIARALIPLLHSTDPRENFYAGWGFYHLGRNETWSISAYPDVLRRMYVLWRTSPDASLKAAIGQTIAFQDFTGRSSQPQDGFITADAMRKLHRRGKNEKSENRPYIALYVAWYWSVLENDELGKLAVALTSPDGWQANQHSYRFICEELGVSVEQRRKT